MDTPKFIDFLIVVYDFGLLGYFLYQGVKHKNNLISIFAIMQLFLLIIVLLAVEHSNTANIYVDKITAMFYLIVAIIGVPIAVFATKYMEYGEKRKHTFVAIVVWFLGVMNFAVSANNIEWFFALFETTTLASFLMIRFRGDKEAVNNANLALCDESNRWNCNFSFFNYFNKREWSISFYRSFRKSCNSNFFSSTWFGSVNNFV